MVTDTRMIRKKFSILLTEMELDQLTKRFHYEEKDIETITHLYYAAEPLVNVSVTMEINPSYSFLQGEENLVIAVTLGKGMDQLIHLYEEEQRIREAYMLDCIGMELLRKSYMEIEKYLQTEWKLWATKMEFVGETCGIENLQEILQHMDCAITCNRTYMMIPQKSVVYFLKVQDEKPDTGGAICSELCSQCGNISCPNRVESKKKQEKPLTYGYQKIFGGKS